MRLALHMAYWGVGPSADEQVRFVQEAEALGYDSVWAGEAYGSDAISVLGWLAGQTSTIGLGTAIAQMPARTPTALAMAAASLDVISGGRMEIGLGPSGPQVAEGWYGQRFAKQLARTREYIAVLRQALAGERVDFHGETFEAPLPDGLGKPLKLITQPLQERMPIHLAAIGPKATALAGEVADGWMPLFLAPEHIETVREHLDEGIDRAGRNPSEVRVMPTIYACVDEDETVARDGVRELTALYVGGMGAREKNFYNALVRSYGFEDAAARVQDLYLDGHKDEAAAALPDELLDLITLNGPPEKIAERLTAYEQAGVDTILVSIVARDGEHRLEQLRALATARAGAAI